MRIRYCRLVIILFAMLALSVSAVAETWYCPQCGRRNDSNFCPVDGTAKPSMSGGYGSSASSGSYSGSYSGGYGQFTNYAHVTGTLNQRLSTRTGPGTQYDEPGSFFSAGTSVTLLSKAYDTRNGIWWVQAEFSYNGKMYRAYTGAKRFDGLNLSALPEEVPIGYCYVGESVECFYGPSYNYKQISRNVPAGVSCEVYGYASGGSSDFIQIEFYDAGAGKTRRAWIAEWNADTTFY